MAVNVLSNLKKEFSGGLCKQGDISRSREFLF